MDPGLAYKNVIVNVVFIGPDKARKGVIYPLKTGIYALVKISECTLTRSNFNKGVRYAPIKIPARTFHSLASFALTMFTFATFIQLLDVC